MRDLGVKPAAEKGCPKRAGGLKARRDAAGPKREGRRRISAMRDQMSG
jgi:hypothetical protein